MDELSSWRWTTARWWCSLGGMARCIRCDWELPGSADGVCEECDQRDLEEAARDAFSAVRRIGPSQAKAEYAKKLLEIVRGVGRVQAIVPQAHKEIQAQVEGFLEDTIKGLEKRCIEETARECLELITNEDIVTTMPEILFEAPVELINLGEDVTVWAYPHPND